MAASFLSQESFQSEKLLPVKKVGNKDHNLTSVIGALMGVHCGLISVNNQAQHSCLLTSCWWLGGEYQKNKNEKTPKELRYRQFNW